MEYIIIKRGQLKTLIFLLISILFLLISVFALSQSLNLTNSSSQDAILNTPVLAEFVNGKSINTLEVQNYIKWYNNFSSIRFEEIGNKTEVSTAMQVGNFDHKLRGLIINNKKYALELLACDERTKGCGFKINGIPTDKIYSSEVNNEPKTFSLDNEYNIKINSILFNFCDHKRFCDAHFEAYDLVNVSIIKKGG